MNRRSAARCVTALFAACLAQPVAPQGQERYKARRSTVPMDGGMRESAAGNGANTAVLSGTKLTINGTFDGLRSPATAARLHSGPTKGVRGAAVGELTISKA